MLDSLDGFSRSRDADLAEIPCLLKLARRGATELVRDHDYGELERWQAYDTLSLHRRRTLSCGMRERLQAYGGDVQVDTQPGQGFRLKLVLPLEPASRRAGQPLRPAPAATGAP